jgi:NAD(P)-dependent dehydrogenase (short-subunit alcohol dehydrogenase family)
MERRKSILLVGASGGVGLAIARDLANAGYDLALHYFENSAELEVLAGELRNEGANVQLFPGDITQEAEVQELVKAAENAFGGIDVLINNAGVSQNGMTWKMPIDKWQQSLDVNLTGPFLCIKHVLPGMRARNFGRIISVTSVVAQTGVAGTVAYSASKAGLIGMTKTIAKEVANKNINVNCIALGYFDAGMLYEIPEEMREVIRETIPQKAFGDTKTISKSIIYLSSEEAGYVTGQTLSLNGGLH